jgi:hypothetical protein
LCLAMTSVYNEPKLLLIPNIGGDVVPQATVKNSCEVFGLAKPLPLLKVGSMAKHW